MDPKLHDVARTLMTQFVDADCRVDLHQLLRDLEAACIMWILEETAENRAKAADMLKMNRTTLVEKMRRLKIPSRKTRA